MRKEKVSGLRYPMEIRMPLLMMDIVGLNWIDQPSIVCARQQGKEERLWSWPMTPIESPASSTTR